MSSSPVRTAHSLLLAGAVLAAATLLSPSSATSAELLGVKFDEGSVGVIHVAIRDGKDAKLTLKADGAEISYSIDKRRDFSRWQPLVVMVDTSHISSEKLESIKASVKALADARFGAEPDLDVERMSGEPPIMIVADQSGNKAELVNKTSLSKSFKDMRTGWVVEDLGGKKFVPSNINVFLGKVYGAGFGKKGRGWGIVYSSLCVGPEDESPDLTPFKGPVRFMTWDEGLDRSCLRNRAKWLKGIKGEFEVIKMDGAENQAAIKKGLTPPPLNDEILRISGVPYEGGPLNLVVALAGAEPGIYGGGEDSLPGEWSFQAKRAGQMRTKIGAGLALGVFFIGLLLFALWRARSSALELSKWEEVGEAEEIIEEVLDDDAWNATIFQLTGAMPALKDIEAAAQLGPSAEAAAPPPPPADAEVPTSQLKPSSAAGAVASADAPSTGMTVNIPVLDDGSDYDAEKAFEVGVLLKGKPVARKTKKFRKTFSIGRATDNRVVIQKDDTVHRYHVIIRPAVQGKEWWLEVAPSATNRTNLNGKDLRAGGRYRLPPKFRLQLGESTEVRGRLGG